VQGWSLVGWGWMSGGGGGGGSILPAGGGGGGGGLVRAHLVGDPNPTSTSIIVMSWNWGGVHLIVTPPTVIDPAPCFGRLELAEVQECMRRHDRVINDVDSAAFTVEVCGCMQRSSELRLCFPDMCESEVHNPPPMATTRLSPLCEQRNTLVYRYAESGRERSGRPT